MNQNTHGTVIAIASLIAGLGLVGFIILYTPIFDLLYLFAYTVLIPLIFLSAFGLIGNGLVGIFVFTAPELNQRIRHEVAKLNATG